MNCSFISIYTINAPLVAYEENSDQTLKVSLPNLRNHLFHSKLDAEYEQTN